MIRAVVLAGGRGRRLGAITNRIPKPLVKIRGNHRTLDFVLDWLTEYLLQKDICLSLLYKGTMVKDHLDNQDDQNRFRYHFREEDYGTAGALKQLESQLASEFLVVNGDTITNVDLSEMAKYHEEENCQLTVFSHDDAIHSGGVYLMSKDLLQLVKPKTYLEVPDLVKLALDRGYRIGVYTPTNTFYYDTGTPLKLEKARKELA